MAFGYYKVITIDAAQCGTADSSDFPVTIFITDADYATIANGGKAANANGYDIRPFSDAGLTSALFFELVSYTATTGTFEMHVKVSTLSHTTNGTIYLAVGDAGISTDGSSTVTWDSNFIGVYHLPDGTTLSVADSTNTNGGTNHSATASASGQINGAAAFNGSSQYISTPIFTLGTVHTISFWVNYQNSADAIVIGGADSGGGFIDYAPYVDGPGAGGALYYRPGVIGLVSPVSVVHGGLSGLTLLTIVRNGTAVAFFKNGSQLGTTQTLLANYALNTIRYFGNGNGNELWLNGILDEIRISTTNRATSWITAEYNNQKSSSTFLSWGSLIPVGGGFLPAWGARANHLVSGGSAV